MTNEKNAYSFFFFSPGRRHSYVITRKLNWQHCNDVTQKTKYIKQLCSLDCNLLTCKWYRKRLVLGSVTVQQHKHGRATSIKKRDPNRKSQGINTNLSVHFCGFGTFLLLLHLSIHIALLSFTFYFHLISQ